MEKRHILEIRQNDEPGFQPLVTFGTWRITVSNAEQDEQAIEISRHFESDESFVLLKSSCILIVSDQKDVLFHAEAFIMQPQVVYSVPRGIWHLHLMTADSKLLIIENDQTGVDNSETVPLSATEQMHLIAIANKASAKSTDS